jgi:lysophospholipase L1-like esterase
VDLFGQRLPTTVTFEGPVRPRLELRQIALGEQIAQFAASDSDAAAGLQSALVSGWVRFFVWQLAVAAAIAVQIFGAAAGWLRHRTPRTIGLIAAGLVVTLALDAGAVMVTAYSVPDRLKTVRSLQDMVGAVPLPDLPSEAARDQGQVRTVAVIGDSTAAGLGNPVKTDPSQSDSVCGRSGDAFAEVLASANGWDVTNLACSRATIRSGLLGDQVSRSLTLPPQVAQPAVEKADLIIVSVGANDVNWASMLQLCAVSQDCANNAEQAYFQQQLSVFSTDLLQLIAALQQLPHHPGVIINQYYDPFPDDVGCLAGHGLTEAKQKVLQSDLAALNSLLAASAQAAGFTTVKPDFTGHGVCGPYPYVQGLDDPAPFHPTAAGQLAIALADQYALHAAPQ